MFGHCVIPRIFVLGKDIGNGRQDVYYAPVRLEE